MMSDERLEKVARVLARGAYNLPPGMPPETTERIVTWRQYLPVAVDVIAALDYQEPVHTSWGSFTRADCRCEIGFDHMMDGSPLPEHLRALATVAPPVSGAGS